MTDIEKVQLLIGTVVAATFSDAQIQAFLDMGVSVFMAAALALKSYAATTIEAVKSESIGDYSYTKSAIDNALKLAANFEERDGKHPAVGWGEVARMGGQGGESTLRLALIICVQVNDTRPK